ncbi:SAFB-like transcription modulator [Platysternon megacephalum]|uniref:SAFB-like transcription modulator n=1 Tax=Platysternon megacephalum TaxID=55544 RepID=A0A4D9DZ78_9SAUR|nr:SAFB-like transcription modulator [Platysternon megacephalum]
MTVAFELLPDAADGVGRMMSTWDNWQEPVDKGRSFRDASSPETEGRGHLSWPGVANENQGYWMGYPGFGGVRDNLLSLPRQRSSFGLG